MANPRGQVQQITSGNVTGEGRFRQGAHGSTRYVLALTNSTGREIGSKVIGDREFWLWVRDRINDAYASGVVPAPVQVLPKPRTTWAPIGSTPLSDIEAAALITDKPETRPANAAANAYVPSDAELAAFRSAVNHRGETNEQLSPLSKYITGRPGLEKPTTDELIQWTAQKWGIPEDIVRAQMITESWWNQSALGDRVDGVDASKYPAYSRIDGDSVYESLGISQVKWRPDGSRGTGTEPLRWKSTAFNLDFYGAWVRFYYDDPGGKRSAWGDASYVRGQEWNSIGGWYQPYPWGNSGQLGYIAKVKDHLARRTWES